ncbi:MAG: hydroxymethylpyrimidine/phosphomethylpyrimidine kinase [Deltaproteobacteria bacterium]|nr:hydroxymethylpyrimidine/phosphomethylpyrimidine kinase [Deltaproteobacteria bacterium]
MSTQSIILSVGGLDPTGGAGVLVDVAAARAVGVHGAAVLAVLTVQDGQCFTDSQTMATGSVRGAIEKVLGGTNVGAVKTGALGNAEMVEMIAELASRPSFPPLVVDPVIRSTTGGVLLDEDGVQALVNRLLPAAALVTPNLAEARLLTGCETSDARGMRLAGRRLVKLGADAVLVKGGHLKGDELFDVFVDKQGNEDVYRVERRNFGEVRGTGCALASLAAGLIAGGEDIVSAVRKAREILLKAMENSRAIGPGPRVLDFS